MTMQKFSVHLGTASTTNVDDLIQPATEWAIATAEEFRRLHPNTTAADTFERAVWREMDTVKQKPAQALVQSVATSPRLTMGPAPTLRTGAQFVTTLDDAFVVILQRAHEANVTRPVVPRREPVVKSTLPVDADGNKPGVLCTAAIVGSDGRLVGQWAQRTTYSANFAGQENTYLLRTGDGHPGLRREVDVGNLALVQDAKPNITGLQVMGNASHAEDRFFALYFQDFVRDVKAAPGFANLPPLLPTDIEEMMGIRPRVEFMTSLPPCDTDATINGGCRTYFRVLRREVGRIPIVIFCYRPFETAQGKQAVYSVALDGTLVTHAAKWTT